MGFFQSVKTQLGTAGELLGFVWGRKKWMFPLILALLVIAFLVAFVATAGTVAPFIYTLF